MSPLSYHIKKSGEFKDYLEAKQVDCVIYVNLIYISYKTV